MFSLQFQFKCIFQCFFVHKMAMPLNAITATENAPDFDWLFKKKPVKKKMFESDSVAMFIVACQKCSHTLLFSVDLFICARARQQDIIHLRSLQKQTTIQSNPNEQVSLYIFLHLWSRFTIYITIRKKRLSQLLFHVYFKHCMDLDRVFPTY